MGKWYAAQDSGFGYFQLVQVDQHRSFVQLYGALVFAESKAEL